VSVLCWSVSMKIQFSTIFFLVFVFSAFGQQLPSDKMFRDDSFPYSFAYPKDWITVPPSHPQTRVKLFSDLGLGIADFSVIVVYNKPAERFSPQEFVNTLKTSPEVIKSLVKQGNPTAEIINTGETYLSNQKAFYIKGKQTVHSLGSEVKMTILQILLLYEGNTYTLTCRAEEDSFDDYYPTFKRIISNFVVRPTKFNLSSPSQNTPRRRTKG